MRTTLFAHPRIYSLAAEGAVSGGIVARGGSIVFVGPIDEARRLAGEGAEEVALPGEAVIPAFHDAHIHTGDMARSRLCPELGGAISHAEVIERLERFGREHPGDAWVFGGGWDRNAWTDGVAPHRSALDAIFPDRPVALQTVDGHSTWANSAALALGGITRDTPDPDGGEIVRDELGEPTGILLETAQGDLRRRGEATASARLPELLLEVQRQLLAEGISTVTDLDGEDVLAVYRELHERGELIVRVVKGIPAAALDQAIAESRTTGDGDDRLSTGPVKLFADGALGSHTAHLSEDFEGEPGNRGIEVTPRDTLVERARLANEHGIAVAVHAIGDRANALVLDVFAEVAERARERGLRNRVEHAQHIRPEDLDRFAALGVVASQQPTHCTSDYPLSVNLLGGRDLEHYPWRSLLASGAIVAFGSDAPVEPSAPFLGIHAAVTRQTRDDQPDGGREPHERVSVLEALRGFTLGGARAASREHIAGTIEAGRLADFIAVDRDPFTIDPRHLWRTRVLTTVVGGTIVHQEHSTEEA